MENYRDLIITLIKNHRKYPGCEDILDEIADEVMSKAKTIVENVNDEVTVRNYLIKTVSAAMIIVPKRHNISTRMTRRSSLSGMILPKSMTGEASSIEQEDIKIEENDNYIETEPVIENAIDDDNTPVFEENIDNDVQEESLSPILDEADIEQPLLSDDEESENNEYDNTLVDRMINEIAPEDSGIVYEENEMNGTDTLESLLDLDDDEPIEVQDEELPEFDISEPANNDDINDITNIEEEEEEEEETRETNNYELPNLEVFKFKQNDRQIDTSEVREKLSELITKHSDMQYDIIWKLKYVENKSADEIADVLNIDLNDALERLEDIVSVVED